MKSPLFQLQEIVGCLTVTMLLWLPLSALADDALASPKIHQVAGGPGEVFANSYIIEGELGVVVVDALLTRSASRELRLRINGLGKPLLAVIVTHGHPDHYGGVTQLVEGQSEVPVVAIKGVDAIIRRDDAMKGERLKAFGIDWAQTRTFPNVLVDGGVRLTFGDITLTPIDIGAAESHHDSAWILEAANGEHVFVGDQVMNGVHAYTADAHTGKWIASLRRLERDFKPAVRIYPGHGEAGGLELIRMQIHYLEKFRGEVRALASTAGTLSQAQVKELERHMIEYSGHDRMSRWIEEGAVSVAREIAGE